jgi:aryl-alcohol dehydrogenase-like predicted oxidoreductase
MNKALPTRKLGKTGIRVSALGIGTGTSGFSGQGIQASMRVEDLAGILLRGYEWGINLWDTAYSYHTYPHICEALKAIPRGDIVLTSKSSQATYKTAMSEVEKSLMELKTDYLDVCFLHGMRSRFDFTVRHGALKALLECKKKGYIRAVGFSCHGMGAMEKGLDIPEIDVILARLNYAGAYMDSYQEGFISKCMSIPIISKMAYRLIPRTVLPSISKMVEPPKPDNALQDRTKELLKEFQAVGRGVIGMKLFGAGLLVNDPNRAIAFARSVEFVDSFIVGMCSITEVEQNVRLFLESGVRQISDSGSCRAPL